MVQYSIVPNTTCIEQECQLLMAEYTDKNSVSPYFGLSQIERTSLRSLKSDIGHTGTDFSHSSRC